MRQRSEVRGICADDLQILDGREREGLWEEQCATLEAGLRRMKYRRSRVIRPKRTG